MNVYRITYRGYTYVPGPGIDWQLDEPSTKNVMASTSLFAVDELRRCPSNSVRRIEIQDIEPICTVDQIAEQK